MHSPYDDRGRFYMKILFYYWMQYNDLNTRGGGVQVYLKNIINELRKDKDCEIYTLSSGIAYDLSGKCYVQELPKDGNIRRFQVINSPMLAPSKSSFYEQDVYLKDRTLKEVVNNFLDQIHGVDVIHFQSFEGLTLSVLELKKEYPQTHFIASVHNYQYFCPQVNLWKNDSISCDDFHNGKDCCHCLGGYPSAQQFKKYYLLDFYLRKVGLGKYSKPLLNKVKDIYHTVHKEKENQRTQSNFIPIDSDVFKDFRSQNIKYINDYIDTVLCVSKRVRDIAVSMGIKKNKALVSYIGSNFASNQALESKYIYNGDVLKIAYMGYMRKDKGFYFLLDTLSAMPENLSKRLAIVIAARFDDSNAVAKLETMKSRFADITLYNGYTRNQIPSLTKGVNLGVVPVLWEDNLPQVAIEFKAMGIPVFASNRGGPSELSGAEEFIFKSGDKEDFIRKLTAIIDNPGIFARYWDKQMKLITMAEHVNQLLSIYSHK